MASCWTARSEPCFSWRILAHGGTLLALDGWLYAYVPAWDTVPVIHLLERIGDVPAIHFGDLDANGVRIFFHLRQQRPGLRWFIPPFWAEMVESKGLDGSCGQEELELAEAPALVRELASRGRWLEQESRVVDPRIPAALEAML